MYKDDIFFICFYTDIPSFLENNSKQECQIHGYTGKHISLYKWLKVICKKWWKNDERIIDKKCLKKLICRVSATTVCKTNSLYEFADGDTNKCKLHRRL